MNGNRRRHSVEMTSVDHVTSRQQPPVVHGPPPPPPPSSSSHAGPARSSLLSSYERELEGRLELMRQRALSAEQRATNERLKRQQLMQRLNNTHATDTELTQRLQQLQHQLTLVGDHNRRLETQLQRQTDGQDRCDVATQTYTQLDTSTLYQLLANITLDRVRQLELGNNHLPSRDTSPANQLRRTSSLPADDVRRDDSQLARAAPAENSHHHHHDTDDSVTQSCMTSDVKSQRVKRHRTSHLDIFKKLHATSRRSQADVINTYKQPIRVRHDVIPCDVTPTSSKSSSFNRLQQRRNGLVDL